MIWQDTGFLLTMNKYNENSSISEFYTLNYGKVTGFIFGATSAKIKNYLFIGNNFYLNFNSKNENKIGYFKIEINKIQTPIYLDNEKKLLCIIYSMNLIKILTVESQENKNIYNLIDSLFEILSKDNWLIDFILWELNFYKNIGYDINFENYVKKVSDKKENEKFIVESNDRIIPNFLIYRNNISKDFNDVVSGFKIVGEFLEKTILKPNNITYPISRSNFLNSIKRF